ncbi:hypothetical protein [Nostoc sp.]
MPNCPYRKISESGEITCDVENHPIVPRTRWGVKTCNICPDNYYTKFFANLNQPEEAPKKPKKKLKVDRK